MLARITRKQVTMSNGVVTSLRQNEPGRSIDPHTEKGTEVNWDKTCRGSSTEGSAQVDITYMNLGSKSLSHFLPILSSIALVCSGLKIV